MSTSSNRSWVETACATLKVIGFPVYYVLVLAFDAKKWLLDIFARNRDGLSSERLNSWWKGGRRGSLSSTKDLKNVEQEEDDEDFTDTDELHSDGDDAFDSAGVQSSTAISREGWNNPSWSSSATSAHQTNSNHQHLAPESNRSGFSSSIHLNVLKTVSEPNSPDKDNFHASNNTLLESTCNGIDGPSIQDVSANVSANDTAMWNSFSDLSSDLDQPTETSKSGLSKCNDTAEASNLHGSQECKNKTPIPDKRKIADEPEVSASSPCKLAKLSIAPPHASNDESIPLFPADITHLLEPLASPGPSSVSDTGPRNKEKNNETYQPEKSCDSTLPWDIEEDNGDGENNDKKKKRFPAVIPDYIAVIPGDKKMFQCIICNRKFKTKGHIKYHESSCATGIKPRKCEDCGKTFISKSHYDYHARTHTGERPHACPNCPKTFIQPGHLKRHMRTHTGEKPFICSICDSRFIDAAGLQSHNVVHIRERRFACKFCGKTFAGITSLLNHKITHTVERPHVCTHCGKGFGFKWNLDQHMKTHSSKRPYACDRCDSDFQLSKDLERHLLTHFDKKNSGEKAFQCTICEHVSRRKGNLQRHILTIHNKPENVKASCNANEAKAE